MAKPVVLLYEQIHKDALAILEEKAEIRWAESLHEDALLKQIADVEGIIIRANGRVSRRLMEAAPKLKVVGRHGIGKEGSCPILKKQESLSEDLREITMPSV